MHTAEREDGMDRKPWDVLGLGRESPGARAMPFLQTCRALGSGPTLLSNQSPALFTLKRAPSIAYFCAL
jgi:hypothetical protein